MVLDASALLSALLSGSTETTAVQERIGSEECHAPHLIDAELGSVLRRQVLRGALHPAIAEALLAAGTPLVDFRHEMTGSLAQVAWALRDNLSYYDALYVALAQALAAPLLTVDGRLARSPRLPCVVELIGA